MEQDAADKEAHEISEPRHIGIIFERIFDVNELEYAEALESYEQEVTVRDPFRLEISESTESAYFVDRIETETGTMDINPGPTILIGTLKVNKQTGERFLTTMTGRDMQLNENDLVVDPTNFKVSKYTLNPKYAKKPEDEEGTNV
jgi:hypothetical protein